MAGKVRTAMATIEQNIKNIHKHLDDGDFASAKREWGLAKASIYAFNKYVTEMSGKSKTLGKHAKVAAFQLKIDAFTREFGDTLDHISS